MASLNHLTAVLVGMVICFGHPAIAAPKSPKPSTDLPAAAKTKPHYKKDAIRPAKKGIIRVYKDFNAWGGENRDEATLLALGRELGVDWFVHPVADCQAGIPKDTGTVLFTSNSFGDPNTSATQSSLACQEHLRAFLKKGGTLVVDMADNDFAGGFAAPGATGTPTLIFPDDGINADLAPAAFGQDGVAGTPDDHPIVKGPDGVAGTADDLNDANIDGCCSVAHGHLDDGILLPNDAVVLITSTFNGVPEPILAEYCVGKGRVLLDTLTKEIFFFQPEGLGPSFFLTNLLAYALDNPKCKGRGSNME